MLSEDKIIDLYYIVDDMLKAMRHYNDRRASISDSEIITTAFKTVCCFCEPLDNARHFMQLKGCVPGTPDKFCYYRRCTGWLTFYSPCSPTLAALCSDKRNNIFQKKRTGTGTIYYLFHYCLLNCKRLYVKFQQRPGQRFNSIYFTQVGYDIRRKNISIG